ncbi:MAG: HisA/HisF-related TIM barrel protein, partial [Bacillota bacterium]
MGVKWALVTDVWSDGTLAGTNAAAALAVSRQGLRVLAAGGIASAADVARLAGLGELAGVVIGRALYEGTVTLREALEAARWDEDAGAADHTVS